MPSIGIPVRRQTMTKIMNPLLRVALSFDPKWVEK